MFQFGIQVGSYIRNISGRRFYWLNTMLVASDNGRKRWPSNARGRETGLMSTVYRTSRGGLVNLKKMQVEVEQVEASCRYQFLKVAAWGLPR